MTPPSPPPERSRAPWGANDVTASLTLQILVLAVLGFALGQARSEATVPDQEPWAVLAVVAAVASGAANGRWLATGRRAVARRRRRLLHIGGGPAPARPAVANTPVLLAGAAMTRYHRAGCTLAQGKPVDGATRSVHEAAGRRPCDWCRP